VISPPFARDEGELRAERRHLGQFVLAERVRADDPQAVSLGRARPGRGKRRCCHPCTRQRCRPAAAAHRFRPPAIIACAIAVLSCCRWVPALRPSPGSRHTQAARPCVAAPAACGQSCPVRSWVEHRSGRVTETVQFLNQRPIMARWPDMGSSVRWRELWRFWASGGHC